MRRFTVGLVLCALAAPGPAFADGQRDLEDGIAFYENLDTDRAMERLTRATTATDLGPPERARAYLYLGMLQFEIGSTADAKKSWTEAIKLDRDIKIPDGTSPKTIEAIEDVRGKLGRAPGDPKEPPPTSPPPPKSDPPPPPPVKIDPPPPPRIEQPPPPPPDLSSTEMPPPVKDDDGSNTWLWVGIGAGAAVVVATVVIIAVVVAGGGEGGECDGQGGGCLGVTFQ